MVKELLQLLKKYQSAEWVEVAELCNIPLSPADFNVLKRKLRSAELQAIKANAKKRSIVRQSRRDTDGDLSTSSRDVESSYGRWLELIGNTTTTLDPVGSPKKKAMKTSPPPPQIRLRRRED
jgi:hypothetical protein